MSSEQFSAGSSGAATAYAVFLWQLMKARDALKALSSQAVAAVDRDVDVALHRDDANKLVLGLLAVTGRSMRNEIAQSIRNNCAGAVLQIVWSLFDAHLEMLGIDRLDRRNVRAGHAFAGAEKFSRILWAARNAFVHGNEWASAGPQTRAGKMSVDILKAVGFAEPAQTGVYDYFILLSDGDIEVLIERLQTAAKDVAQSREEVAVPPSGVSSALVAALLVIGMIAIAYFSAEKAALEIDDDVVVLFQLGEGDDARTVPIASGRIHSPLRLRSIMEEQAIEALPNEAARPFKEVAARLNAWTAEGEALMKTDVGSERFYRDLLDMAERMDQIYEMVVVLPNPVSLLLKERKSNSMEDAQAILASLFEASGEFKSAPFRVINKDVLSLSERPCDR